MNKQVIIVENYFDHFNLILPEIKKIKLYSQKEFNKKYTDQIQTWPGQRSGDLCLENPILLAYALSYFNKFNINVKNVKVFSYIHFRGEDQINKDWIHKDHCTYSMLIYLNSTNLNSGTYLYDENNNMITDIKYVQNRAVLYNGSYNHMGYGHFGKSAEDGRLTLNFFIHLI
jgi:hypothetical protein